MSYFIASSKSEPEFPQMFVLEMLNAFFAMFLYPSQIYNSKSM